MTREEFAAQMGGMETMCLTMHGKSPLADEVVEVYWRILGGYEIEQLTVAVTSLLREWRWPRMPLPAEILERMPARSYDEAAEIALGAVRYRALYTGRYDEDQLPTLDAVAVDLLVDGFGSVADGLLAFRRAEHQAARSRLHHRFLRAHEKRRDVGLLSDGRTVEEATPPVVEDPARLVRLLRRVAGGGERPEEEKRRRKELRRERLRER